MLVGCMGGTMSAEPCELPEEEGELPEKGEREYTATVGIEVPPWLWEEVCEEVIHVAENEGGKGRVDVEEYLLDRVTLDIDWHVAAEE